MKQLSWWDRMGMTPGEIAAYENQQRQEGMEQSARESISSLAKLRTMGAALPAEGTEPRAPLPLEGGTPEVYKAFMQNAGTGAGNPRIPRLPVPLEQARGAGVEVPRSDNMLRNLARIPLPQAAREQGLGPETELGQTTAAKAFLSDEAAQQYAGGMENEQDRRGFEFVNTQDPDLAAKTVAKGLSDASDPSVWAQKAAYDTPENRKSNEDLINSLVQQNPPKLSAEDALAMRNSNQGAGVYDLMTSLRSMATSVTTSVRSEREKIPVKIEEENALRGPKASTAAAVAGASTTASNAANQENQDFNKENALRDDYSKKTTNFVVVRDAYNRILASGNEPSPAGDLSLLFQYMKILDPGSVVRESEFAQAAKTGSLPTSIQAVATRLVNGERLTDGQRKDFLTRSTRLYEAQLKGQQALESSYKEMALGYGLRPENVVVDFSSSGGNTGGRGAARAETRTVNGVTYVKGQDGVWHRQR